MGAALAEALLEAGYEVWIVSGPVQIDYPSGSRVQRVTTTNEMLEAATNWFGECDGVIGAAAPCDYEPRQVSPSKLAKDGSPRIIELVETPDVVATLGKDKRRDQWVVGFALETEDQRFRATVKLERKHCDLMISNGPSAINSDSNEIEILDPTGDVILSAAGTKIHLAKKIVEVIHRRLVFPQAVDPSN